jgi:hypothetical protein
MSYSDICDILFIVCGLILLGAFTAPVLAQEVTIEKTVSEGPYFAGDEITWTVTVTNNESEEVDLVVQEDTSGLKNVTWISNTSDAAGYTFSPEGVWTFTLPAGESANLTLVTAFNESGSQTNRANITLVNGSYPLTILDADATITLGKTVTATLEIKPETLNLHSKGLFTVFINVTNITDGAEIDLENSNLTCNDSVLKKFAGNGKNKIIAKFARTGLGVEAAENATITCVGEVAVGEEIIRVQGSDTIRVIGEPREETFMDKILKFLGFKKGDAEDPEAIPTFTLPEDITKLGQAKKYLRENPPETPPVTQDSEEMEETIEESEIGQGKPDKEAHGKPPVTECPEGTCGKVGKNK